MIIDMIKVQTLYKKIHLKVLKTVDRNTIYLCNHQSVKATGYNQSITFIIFLYHQQNLPSDCTN